MMTKKQRIDSLAIFIAVLLSSFVLSCIVGSVEPYFGDGTVQTALQNGLIGCLILTAGINGTVLTAQFLSRRSTGFRIAAAVLWIVTLLCSLIGATLIAIPYQIYNIIRIATDKGDKASAAKEMHG